MAGYSRCEKPKVDTSIDTRGLGGACEVYNALRNKKLAIQARRIQGPACDPLRFSVQHQLTDSTTFMFVLTDNETGEDVAWSVKKLYIKETAEHAFQRDYVESALRYNSGVVRALEDHVEAFQVQYPGFGYLLESTESGYHITRPLTGSIAVVPFRMDILNIVGAQPYGRTTNPLIWDTVGGIAGEAGRSLARLLVRYIALGVVWDVEHIESAPGYTRTMLLGSAACNAESHIQFVIQLRDHQATDPQLANAHTYYA